jgi:hypothetical protein
MDVLLELIYALSFLVLTLSRCLPPASPTFCHLQSGGLAGTPLRSDHGVQLAA